MGPIELRASNTVTEHNFPRAADKCWEFPNAPGGYFIYVKLSAGGKAEFGWSTDSAPPPGTTAGTTYDRGPAEAPRGVAGYRVDVRQAGDTIWTSLTAVHTDHLKAGAFDAGVFDGELWTEVHPRKIYDKIWLPAYFASWTGGSMVVDTTDDKALRGNPAPKAPLFLPVHLDTPLRYGNSYEFRVRMVDASGGGPDLTGAPLTPGDSPISAVNFRRFLPPKKLRLVNQTTDATGTEQAAVGAKFTPRTVRFRAIRRHSSRSTEPLWT